MTDIFFKHKKWWFKGTFSKSLEKYLRKSSFIYLFISSVGLYNFFSNFGDTFHLCVKSLKRQMFTRTPFKTFLSKLNVLRPHKTHPDICMHSTITSIARILCKTFQNTAFYLVNIFR